MKQLVYDLCRDMFGSYASFRNNVDHLLLAVSDLLKETFHSEAKAFLQGVHDAFCDAAGGVQNSFVDSPEVVDKSLALIVEHSKRDDLARPRSLSAHYGNCEQQQSLTRAMSDSGDAPKSNAPRSPALASRGATDLPDYQGRCYTNSLQALI